MSLSQEKILEAIRQERKQQDKLWGVQEHTLDRWFTILGEEVGEACAEAWGYYNFRDNDKLGAKYLQDWRKEMIQCAAVIVAALENWDDETS